MPLRSTPKNASPKQKRAIQSQNIKETVDSYKSSGKIGNSKPKNKQAAIRQAVAISYAEQRRRSRNGKSRKK